LVVKEKKEREQRNRKQEKKERREEKENFQEPYKTLGSQIGFLCLRY
jgi:hypothetical protein